MKTKLDSLEQNLRLLAKQGDALISAWAQDPATRNRPERQELSGRLAAIIGHKWLFEITDILEEIRDVLEGRE